MANIQELTDQLASAALMADAEDLTSLAKIHETLARFSDCVAGDATVGSEAQASASRTARDAASLVEQIILRDVKDAAGALASVTGQIERLQQIVEGAVAGPVPTAPAGTPSFGPAQPQLKPDDLPLIADFISEADGHIESAEAALLSLANDPSNQDSINAIFRSFHTIKGVAGFLNLQQIGSLAHAAENLLDLARQGKRVIAGPVLDLALEALDAVKVLIRKVAEAVKTGSAPQDHPGLDDLLSRLHAAALGDPLPTQAAPRKNAEAPAPTTPATTIAASSHNSDATVKVTTTRLDSLINMVGELVIAQAMLNQDLAGTLRGNQRLSRNASHLGKITRELQDLTMSMRMVPIQGVFQKMARLVRDLASKSGKKIDLVLTGSETELDRNLVEAIADPLVHMVRNAADHGVETPEDRNRAGKNPAGRIELKASHQAGNIVIEISDDGRGLDKRRILEKARSAGIVKPDQDLSEQDIFRLIFHAGLSTAEKVTDVSGRGVGMDVVRRNVEALRGRIDIASIENRGSNFTIRLPLTLAVIDGLIVMVGNQRYILPITSIEQSLRPLPETLSTIQNRAEVCIVREQVLPLLRLHRLFAVAPKNENPCDAIIVIVQDNDRRCCILVDELLGQQQVVIKSLGDAMGSIPGVSGGAILGDGAVSLILDVPGLMDLVTSK